MKHFELLLLAVCACAADPEAARESSDTALAAYRRGDLAMSEKLNRQALAEWEALGPKFTAHQAVTRMNLGNTYSGEGKRDKALTELQQALALFRRSVGIRNLDTLTCVNLLAGLELMWNDTADAARLIEEALPVERELYPSDVQTAHTLSEMAMLRLRQDRAIEALAPAEEGLKLTVAASGEDSLDAAFALGIAAEVHRMSGQPDRALPLYRRARALYEKHLGPQHPRIADMLSQEALLLMGENELALAEQNLKRALAILDHSCPGCDLEYWTAEGKLAQVYIRRNKYEAADGLLSDALEREEKTQPRPQADEAETLKNLAAVRQKERRFGDAERLNRRAAALSLQ